MFNLVNAMRDPGFDRDRLLRDIEFLLYQIGLFEDCRDSFGIGFLEGVYGVDVWDARKRNEKYHEQEI